MRHPLPKRGIAGFLLALALLPLPARAVRIEAGRLRFESGEYAEIRDLALKVLKLCPPERCVIVGVGRSPTPLMEFLRAAGLVDLYELPLSGAGWKFEPDPRADPREIGRRLTALHRDHFSAHLPPTTDRRSMVLIDYVVNSLSLRNVVEASRLLAQGKEVSGLGIPRSGMPPGSWNGIATLPDIASALRRRLEGQAYKPFSSVPYFSARTGERKEPTGDGPAAFRQLMEREVARDPELPPLLARLGRANLARFESPVARSALEEVARREEIRAKLSWIDPLGEGAPRGFPDLFRLVEPESTIHYLYELAEDAEARVSERIRAFRAIEALGLATAAERQQLEIRFRDGQKPPIERLRDGAVLGALGWMGEKDRETWLAGWLAQPLEPSGLDEIWLHARLAARSGFARGRESARARDLAQLLFEARPEWIHLARAELRLLTPGSEVAAGLLKRELPYDDPRRLGPAGETIAIRDALKRGDLAVKTAALAKLEGQLPLFALGQALGAMKDAELADPAARVIEGTLRRTPGAASMMPGLFTGLLEHSEAGVRSRVAALIRERPLAEALIEHLLTGLAEEREKTLAAWRGSFPDELRAGLEKVRDAPEIRLAARARAARALAEHYGDGSPATRYALFQEEKRLAARLCRR